MSSRGGGSDQPPPQQCRIMRTQTAGNLGESICDDLLPELLVRLPFKSLARAKCVSKHWRSLIISPYFSLRLNPFPKPPSGILLHPSTVLSWRIQPNRFPKPRYLPFNNNHTDTDTINPLSFFDQNPQIFILQSCNGLLSCFDSARNFLVVNPTTKQCRNLNLPNLEFRHLQCFGVNIAFDPLKSPHYKVICVRDPGFSTIAVPYRQIEIYSSETHSWRSSGEAFTAPVDQNFSDIDFTRGVFWNGAINWISTNARDSLYFNVEQETIHTMPMPHPVCRKVWYFGESANHLHLVECDDQSRIVAEFRIYEMERDYSGWFVRYTVTVNDIRDAYPEMGLAKKSKFSIFCILRRENGNEDESVLVVQLNRNGKVIWYNLMGKPFKKVLDLAPTASSGDANSDENGRANRFGWFNAYQYIESAAPV